jgi:transcriptional regulator with XRE-family HTH domain
MRKRNVVFLGKNLSFLRKSARLTKGELSAVIGTSITEIGQLESNSIAKPNYFILEAVADYFGVDVESLVRLELSQRSQVELTLQRALLNFPELDESEVRSCMLLCNDLIDLLVEKKHFDYRKRLNRWPPPE